MLFQKKDSKQPAQIQNQTVSNGLTTTHTWPHLKLDFLRPEKIKDIHRRTPKDPDYDPKTLYVPTDFLNNQTPVREIFVIELINIVTIINSKIYLGDETMVGIKK